MNPINELVDIKKAIQQPCEKENWYQHPVTKKNFSKLPHMTLTSQFHAQL
uniref:Uncharacterized protein n=1 Tax=Rhizophora mucronata TaxID=61149 RepID=A0A2P2P118_RHIMU